MRLLATSVLLLVIIVGACAYTFGYVVPPGMMGVRRIGFGPGQGYHEVALRPGYHWGVPFLNYSTVHLVPETAQVVHLHRDKNVHPGTLGALEVQTTDGAKVLVDVTILARFFSEPGYNEKGIKVRGGPADLLKEVGLSSHDWYNRIRRNVDDELRRALGKLSTGQFYDPSLREHEHVITAQGKVNKDLARFGIEVESILVRRYTYVADEINQAIARKNLQDQEERLNDMKSHFAKVSAELRQQEADFDAQIKTLEIKGETEAKVIRSEGELYEQTKIAEADLLVAKSMAEVDRLRANALAGSVGAEIFVARELAPILNSLRGGVVSDLNPYDLEEWVERLGVREDKGGAK